MRQLRASMLLPVAIGLVVTLLAGQTAAEHARGFGVVEVRERDGTRVAIYAESHALVIGVSDYATWPSLQGVKRDLREVSGALEKHGFSVEQVTNPDRDGLDRAFRSFITRHGRKRNARLLFYFAGHGHTLETAYGGQMGYMVPREAPDPNRDPDGFFASGLSMETVEVYARRVEAKHALFVFDACFAGSIFEATRAFPDIIAEKTGRPVRQFITSGTAEQKVPDESIFRAQFVAALDGEGDLDGDGYVTGAELGQFLETTVTNYTRRSQTPQYGKLRDPLLDKGDFVFQLPSNAPTDKEAGSSGTIGAEALFWASIKESTDSEDYADYLARFPEGIFTGLAERRMASLRQQQMVAQLPAEEPRLDTSGLTPLDTLQEAALSPAEQPAPALEIEEMDAPYRVVTRSNVRKGPGTRFDKVGTLPPGHAVEVTGKVVGENWYRIAFGGDQEGFIFGKLIQDEKSYEAVQTQIAVGNSSRRTGEVFRDCADCPEMVVIPAGTFMMGSPGTEPLRTSDEGPQRKVRVRQFAIGKYEVTFDEYEACLRQGGCSYRPDDSGWGRGDRPVIFVNWQDVVSYVTWLSKRTGVSYRLPSEAEWEYAARAGTATPFSFGRTIMPSQANYNAGYSYDDGPKGHYLGMTARVGSYPANDFGLYDMHGNVSEWVEDCQHRNYSGAPTDGRAWTTGGECDRRVIRGGSFSDTPGMLRSAHRTWFRVWHRVSRYGFRLGFRVARTLDR